MKPNMGGIDRIVRLVVAAILATLYFTNVLTGAVGIVLLIFVGVFVLTSVVRFCPLYVPFGINTCSNKC